MTTVGAGPVAGAAGEEQEALRRARQKFMDALVHDDPLQLYDQAPVGFLSTTPDGLIVKTNATFRGWTGYDAAELVGVRSFVQLLSVGGRLYHETHFAPMLRMEGQVRELALDLVCADGTRLPVLVNASVGKDPDGHVAVVRIAVFDATERRRYERALLAAKRAADAAEERARELALTLQQTLLPPAAPTIPGLEVAAAYRAAGAGVEVGGDFYDVFAVTPESWLVVLGDVQGKGVEAAAVASLVRHTLRALAVTDSEPCHLLSRLNEVLLRQVVPRFCTVVVLRIERAGAGWRAVVGTGGHAPPLLVRPDAAPVPCRDYGTLVGLLTEAEFTDTVLELLPGDVLVTCTDGVVEGRRGRELFGEDRLVEVVSQHRASPADLVARLVEQVVSFQAGQPHDDVAVLALGVPAPVSS